MVSSLPVPQPFSNRTIVHITNIREAGFCAPGGAGGDARSLQEELGG